MNSDQNSQSRMIVLNGGFNLIRNSLKTQILKLNMIKCTTQSQLLSVKSSNKKYALAFKSRTGQHNTKTVVSKHKNHPKLEKTTLIHNIDCC